MSFLENTYKVVRNRASVLENFLKDKNYSVDFSTHGTVLLTLFGLIRNNS